jgi:hypothetical protein
MIDIAQEALGVELTLRRYIEPALPNSARARSSAHGTQARRHAGTAS